MPTIRFTSALQRHVSCPSATVGGRSVRDALESYFAGNPRARGYVVDERGELRHHVVVFVDGRSIRDRAALSDVVEETSTLDVMQALSGG